MLSQLKIVESYYLSEPGNLQRLITESCLAEDEVIEHVGYFNKTSHRAGKLRGEVVKYYDGRIVLRHHFTKKLYWEDVVC